MALHDRIATLIKEIPARKWMEYSTKFGRETTECMSDGVIAMVIVLNEEHRKTYGSPSLEKFLDMGLAELEAEVKKVLDDGLDDEPAHEAAIFRPGSDGGAIDGGVVADGPGDGVRAEPGAAVRVDGVAAV